MMGLAVAWLIWCPLSGEKTACFSKQALVATQLCGQIIASTEEAGQRGVIQAKCDDIGYIKK